VAAVQPKRIAFCVSARSDLRAGNADLSTIHSRLLSADLGRCDSSSPRPFHECERKTDFIERLDDLLEQWPPADQLVFYFSGHGQVIGDTFCLRFGIRKTDLYPFSDILKALELHHVERAVIIIDACYAGHATKGGGASTLTGEGDSEVLKRNVDVAGETLPKGICVLASSGPLQTSAELSDGSLSVFTKLLCEALDTGLDGTPTVDDNIDAGDIITFMEKKRKSPDYEKFGQRPTWAVRKADQRIWISHNRTKRDAQFVKSPTGQEIGRAVRTPAELQVLYEMMAKERRPIFGATVNHLDRSLLLDFLKSTGKQYDSRASLIQLAEEAGLVSELELGGNYYLHRAAILSFCREPHRFFPTAMSMLVVGDVGAEQFGRTDFSGAVSVQYNRVLEEIKGGLRTISQIGNNGLRIEGLEVDEDLIRELLSNAFVHRSYDRENTGIVEVRITKEYVEFRSPGLFPSNCDWPMLLKSTTPLSLPTDPALVLYAQQHKLSERIGRGFQVIRRFLSENGPASIEYFSLPGPMTCIRVMRPPEVTELQSLDVSQRGGTAKRVYISGSGSEFLAARRRLSQLLRSAGMLVIDPESFRSEPNSRTLLEKTRSQIMDCSAVVCLIGRRAGAYPTAGDAAALTDKLNGVLPPDLDRATYTQWEFFLARHYGVPTLIYRATDSFGFDPLQIDGPDQTEFLAWLDEHGVDFAIVNSPDEFVQSVLTSHVLASNAQPQRARPIILPYASIGSLFKGRSAFLTRLRVSLLRGQSAAVTGLGGVGKTRAAVEYAWAHRNQYTALALLHAETPDRLSASLAALTGPLNLPEHADAKQAVQTEATVSWLNANPGWFLILDNVDTEDAWAAAYSLLGRLSGGHVVLTSRLASFTLGVEPLNLELLNFDDAAALLLEATGTGRVMATDDTDQARALAEDLGGLALALEMAAATIVARRLSFTAYRALWEGNRSRVLGWASQAVSGYHHPVAYAWRTSVEQLTPAGRALLERLAFLAPEPVPWFLLRVPVPGGEGEDAEAALDDLAAYSLLTRDAASDTFRVHRLIQVATRRELTEAGTATERLTQALAWLDAAFDGSPQDVRTWPRLNPLVPHAEAVAGFADVEGIAEPTARLMNQLSVLFQVKALHARAEPLLRRTLAIAEASYGETHPSFAAALSNLAQLLQATNRLAEAEPLMRRALAIDEASFGGTHPSVARNLNNLAQLLRVTNRLAEAEPLMRRALAIDEASLGEDNPNVALRLNNLAALLQNTNRLGEAEPLMRRALAISEANLGRDHPNVAIRLNNLAALLQATNRLAEAEPLMRRALEIIEAGLGRDHPSVATSLNNLGQLLRATNRLTEAESLYRRALAIDKAALGDDHPDVAIDLNNLALLLQATNRPAEAESLMRRVVAIFEASLGREHPNTAASLANLAEFLVATDRLEEAEPLMRRALAVSEASLGPDHPIVATRLNNLAQLLQATNRLAEAEPLMRRQLVIFHEFRRDTGHKHPHADDAPVNYASLLAQLGYDEAQIGAALEAVRREAGVDV